MTRDFVGYGAEPPHARWPGDARVAVNFVINFEEGSELSYPAGDGVSETGLIESASTDAGNRRDLAAESMFEYGSRVGWWRLHRIFTRFKLPVTLFACARALGGQPAGRRGDRRHRLGHLRPRLSLDQALRAGRSRGARPDRARRRADPRDHRQADARAGTAATRRPRTRGGSSSRMAGFSTTATPITTNCRIGCGSGDKPHLVIPYSLTTNDVKFGRGMFGPGEDFFAYLRDSFDLLYEEGADRPRMMSIGLHMRLSGHPGRAKALIRFIEHIMSHDRVWICRREDIARHWIATHPADR